MAGFYRSDWQDRGALPLDFGAASAGAPAQPQQKKRSGWLSFLPLATSIIGGVAGSFVAPGAGTAAGGAGGGALGEWLAQKLSGEKSNIAKIGTEGAFGALGGLGKAFKAGRAATTALRGGEGVGEALSLLRKGAPVVEGLAGAGAGAGGGRLSNFLLRQADDTALRAAKVGGKKEAIKNFEGRFGEDLGSWLRTNKVVGKGAADIEEGIISPLNKQFAAKVKKIGRPITSSDVLAQNQKGLEKLLASSSSDKKKLAQQVFEELDQVFKKGAAIDPVKLNTIKSEYQSLARNAYKLGADPVRGDVNKEVAKLLKTTLQGVSGDDTLKTLGTSLDKAYKASDIVRSGAQLGRGNLSLGLTDLLAAGGGGLVGNIPGAVGAVGIKRAVNSPRVQTFLANKLASTGEKLAGRAGAQAAKSAIEPTAGNVAKGMLKAQAPVRALQFMGNQQPMEAPTDPSALQYDGAGLPPGGGLPGQPGGGADLNSLEGIMGAEAPAQSPYPQENFLRDVSRDPRNFEKYAALYEMLNPEPEQPKPLTTTQQQQANNATSGLGALDTVESEIARDSSILTKANVPTNLLQNVLGAGTFNTARKEAADVITRLRTGAAINANEERFYKSQLPSFGDNDTTIRYKLGLLRDLFSKFANPQQGAGFELQDLYGQAQPQM